jgi:hypothetical protein
MEEIPIAHLSSSHKRKIMKGESFRIKKGEGVMLVHKERIPKIMRAFRNGKGHNMIMSPEEIHANGKGIFGNNFDKFLEKHGAKKLAYSIGDQIKPVAKAAITAGLLGGAAGLTGLETFATGGAGASLAPAIGVGALGLSALADDYLDNPRKYQSTQTENKVAINDLKNAGITKIGQLGSNPYAELNSMTGQQLGALGQANGQQAVANSLNQQLTNAQVFARDSLYSAPVLNGGVNAPSVLQSIEAPTDTQHPKVVSLGSGLHHIIKRQSMNHIIRGKGIKERHGKHIEKGSIGIQGNLLRTSQALESAPFASNFVWSSTLPLAYRRFNATPAPPS